MTDLFSTPVTLLLLVINGIVCAVIRYSDPSLVSRWAFWPARVRHNRQWFRFITGGFVHVDIWHIAFNLITLYFFGPILELRLGSVTFSLVYLGSLLAAHALTYWIHRNNADYIAIGASGAISGVLFGFCLFDPFNLLLLFFVIPMPAIVFAIGFVVASIWAMKKGKWQGIAHEAHLGGALGGVVLTILLEPSALSIFLEQIGL